MRLSNHLVFNSISELVEELDNSKSLDRGNSSDGDGSGYSGVDTYSYDEARNCLLNGKEFSGLDNDIDKYKTKGTQEKRVSKLSVAGHSVVVPLYLQGIPNSMITSKKTINNKIVTIFYSPQAPHHVNQRQLIEGAIKLFKKIISLESQGYRVNLYLIECNDNRYGYCVKLKNDREIFNIKKLQFPLISPSMLRRVGFRIKERLYETWIGGGYGSGIFQEKEYDEFIKKYLKIKNYEIWNYKGKVK